MTQKALTPEQLHALAVVGKAAGKQRKLLTVGNSPVDFTVRITGDLCVAANTTGSTSSKPDLKLLARGLLRAIPKTRRAAVVDELIATKCLVSGEADDALDQLVIKLIEGCTLKLVGTKTGPVTGKFETLVEE